MLGSADAVRAFYESHPYPAPLRDLDRHRALYQNPDRRRALSLLLWPTEKPSAKREILGFPMDLRHSLCTRSTARVSTAAIFLSRGSRAPAGFRA